MCRSFGGSHGFAGFYIETVAKHIVFRDSMLLFFLLLNCVSLESD